MSAAVYDHFKYNELIEQTYKERDRNPNSLNLCIKYCLEDIANIGNFINIWLEEEVHLGKNPPRLPRIPAFERLAIIYEKQGKYAEAIMICQQAIGLGLHDPDKCYSPRDFNSRIAKLQRKLD